MLSRNALRLQAGIPAEPDGPTVGKPSEVTLDSIGGLKLYQRKKGYRYSIDAMLLAGFVGKRKVRHCVDLGAGVGIVGLLIALRYPETRVSGVEIQESLASLAKMNIEINGLGERVQIYSGDLRRRETLELGHKVDLVVSNPPFRRVSAGRICPAEERRIARHEVSLSLEELAASAARMMADQGSFCLVHLSQRLPETLSVLSANGIQPKRLRFVHSKPGQESKLFLLEGIKGGRSGIRVEQPFFLHDETGSESTELKSLLD